MSEFDPYLKWLGIREKHRPINHYRLLGLDLFEDDPDVISMAADRQMTHIRTYQSGPNGDLSQQILNELARARRCLLVLEKKSEYDAELRAAMNQPAEPVNVASPMAPIVPPIAQVVDAATVEPGSAPIVQPVFVQKSTAAMAPQVPTYDSETSPSIGIHADVNARSKTKRRESKQLLWSIFGWISGGLAAVGIAAALIGSGVLGSTKSDDPEEEVVVNEPAVAPVEKKVPTANELVGNLNQPPPMVKDPPKIVARPKIENSASQLFEPDAFEHRYDISNLRTYPKADANSFRLFATVNRGLVEKKSVPLEPSAIASSDLIRVMPNSGGIVIGLAVTQDKDRHLGSVRPIFHNGVQTFVGSTIGPTNDSASSASADPTILIAKPGYTIGEIQVSAVTPVHCLRIKYMKIGSKQLDTSDSYFSKWFGREIGPSRMIRNDRGLPVVGLYASLTSKGGLETMSLVCVDPNGEPEKIAKSTDPENKLPIFFDPKKKENDASEMPDGGPDPFAANPTEATAVAKKTIPTARERTAARKDFSDALEILIAQANDVRSRIRSAEQLIRAAGSESDQALKYVILKEAEAMGVSAGDARTAVDALRGIDESFELDFWKEVLKTIDKAARNLSVRTALDFKDTMDELIAEAQEKSEYDAAGKLLSVGIRLAKRANDAESANEYTKLEKSLKSIEELTETSIQALVVLESNPDDPEANLEQGDYLLVLNDDVDGALKHWSKSENTELVEIVKLESALDDSDGSKLIELADAWYSVGKANRTPKDLKCLRRAYYFYRKAAFKFTGRQQQDVNKKIDQVKKLIDH